jgi:NAD(P)H-flavin reductase
MTAVRIEPSEEIARSYTTPGQFVEVRVDGETGYFVLAGAPGAHPWELVMRPGGGASDVLLPAPIGRAVEVTAAIGDGFPMAAARGRELVVALSGTGIAAGRPIVGRRVADGDAARTQVFVGTRTRAELALAADIGRWREAGVRVVVCLSQPGEVEGEGFARGYVQDVIRDRATRGAWAIFTVGVSSMADALRALAPELGLSPDRVLTNH